MKLGSLFSGIGGIELGLLRSGLVDEVSWAIDNDDFCCKILEQNLPNTLVLNKDITKVKTKYLPKVDILTAGFPCQPVSVAGNQKGIKDERWLWDEVERFINELRPPIFILENVPNILRASNGEAINRVLKGVAEMRYYRFEWQLISAKFVGARHKRQRWVGIGIVGDPEHYGLLRAEIRRCFGESFVSWRSREEEQKKRHWKLTRESKDLAYPNNNGRQRLIEARNEINAGKNEEIIGTQGTEDIERSSLDGLDRERSEPNDLLSRSRDGEQTITTEPRGLDEVHTISNRGDETTKINGDKEINDRPLVQDGQFGLYLPEHRRLEQDQTSLEGTEVRRGNDDDRSNRVADQRGDRNVADAIDTGQRTSQLEAQRERQEDSDRRGRGSISQSSRQSAGTRKFLNTQSESSEQTGQQESPVSSKWITWLYFRDGCWGTESRIDWETLESGMGHQTYGISRWLAELGMINSWGIDNSWENDIKRVAERKPDDVDRLKALGNGVVPQFMELVGRLTIKSLIEDTLVFDPQITKADHPQTT